MFTKQCFICISPPFVSQLSLLLSCPCLTFVVCLIYLLQLIAFVFYYRRKMIV